MRCQMRSRAGQSLKLHGCRATSSAGQCAYIYLGPLGALPEGGRIELMITYAAAAIIAAVLMLYSQLVFDSPRGQHDDDGLYTTA